MAETLDILQFPAAADCVRSIVDAESYARQNDQRAVKNGAMLLYAVTEGARDIERINDTMRALAELPEPSEDEKVERICASAAFQCGYAIGAGECGRWAYDATRHTIVARGEQPTEQAIE